MPNLKIVSTTVSENESYVTYSKGDGSAYYNEYMNQGEVIAIESNMMTYISHTYHIYKGTVFYNN